MEIDSFYQNGDMSFGMDGRIAFADENQYLYARGKKGGGGISRADEVKGWYPDTTDCTELESSIIKAKGDYANNSVKIANPATKRGEKRVLNDYNGLISKRVSELEDLYRKQGCALKKKQAEESSFLTTIQSVANPQMAGQAAGATSGSNTNADANKKKTQIILIVGTIVFIIGLSVLSIKYLKD
jgi:hypothetical protein